jgi:hypothetical protein
MHDLIAKLTEYLKLDPEQQFRVSAMIKRHIHDEKASVFHRYSLHSQGHPIFDRTDPENPILIGREEPRDPFLHNIMKEKAAQHAEWAKKPDEEVITWSVGSFKYVQKVEPCAICGAEITGKPYSRVVENGTNKTFCPEHGPKWDDE